MSINLTRPHRGHVWMTLLMFYGVGITLFIKSMDQRSLGGVCIGALLVLAGIYYSIRWFTAKSQRQKK